MVQEKVLPLQPHSREVLLVTQKVAAIAQLVERNLAKVEVAGPSPVCRSDILNKYQCEASLRMPRWRNW